MSAGSGCEKCAAPIWRVFPHLALCGTLVAYAVLGALIFQRIEGGNKPSKIQEDYREFLGEIVDIVRNHSQNTSCSQSCMVEQVEKKMKTFNSIWFQNPDNWTFFGSMFFCCTVFTTVEQGTILQMCHKSQPIPDMDAKVDADWSEILPIAHKPDQPSWLNEANRTTSSTESRRNYVVPKPDPLQLLAPPRNSLHRDYEQNR
uniref:Potassium channel, subfamily K, member 18 n=1 Tax=Oryzias sinensis TaxID=183150 RepID=A0A8C7XFP8_9TELE